MKSVLLLGFIFMLFSSYNVLGQRLPKSINKNPVNWSRWEIDISEEEKLTIIKTLKNTIEIEFGLKYYSYSVENILSSYHIIDFNKDGKYDIVYNGFAGKSNNGIMFFENRDGKFIKFLQFFGDIVEVWQSDFWTPLSFKIWNYRCCGNYVSFIETYVPRLTYNFNVKYELSNKIAFVDGTDIPDRFDDYLPFKIVTKEARLNAYPKPDTIPYHFQLTKRPVVAVVPQNIFFNPSGNVIANFEMGGSGFILAERCMGEETWFFVMMNYDKLVGGVFCGKGDNEGAAYYMIGWMNGACLKQIPMKKQLMLLNE